jgi:hypothetical protein
MFDSVWIPQAVGQELQEGLRIGYDVPQLNGYSWLEIVNPHSVPYLAGE